MNYFILTTQSVHFEANFDFYLLFLINIDNFVSLGTSKVITV